MFSSLSIPVYFFIVFLFTLFALLVGMNLGAVFKKHFGEDASLGSVIGATFGLLAFMLAFTFNMTASRYDERKHLMLDEINTIETAHLRSGLLPEPYATNAQALLLRYVQIRVKLTTDQSDLMAGIEESANIQSQLWSMVEEMISSQPYSPVFGLYIQSINQLFDLQTERITVGLYFKIPNTIWAGLLTVTAVGMLTLGFQVGSTDKMQLLVNSLLALAFASVLTLITNLDRAQEGSMKLNDEPLLELEQKLLNRP